MYTTVSSVVALFSRETETMDFWPTLYVFVLATFIGLGVIRRV